MIWKENTFKPVFKNYYLLIMSKKKANWIDKKRAATELNYYIGKLMYEKGVELMLYRNSLNEVSISELLNLHDYARKFVGDPIEIENSVLLAKMIYDHFTLELSKIDIGKLNDQWIKTGSRYQGMVDFLKEELAGILAGGDMDWKKPVDVVLYGFGRIGRLCARSIIDMTGIGAQLRLRAIVTRKNDPAQIIKRADLLRNDSVHGAFKGVIDVDASQKKIIINGEEVHMIASSDPGSIDYSAFDIEDALVIDNTGVWRDESLEKHLQSKGIAKVLLTAPGKDMPNVVYGVNHKEFSPGSTALWSAASCTTNAIVPVLKVVDDVFGISGGHIETIHAYTNDQNLLDNMHRKHRRGRSAAINMVITETGAAKAVGKVMPHLKGILSGSAVRVPVPNGSLAIMNIKLRKDTTIEDIDQAIKEAALKGDLRNQIKYSFQPELVSTDIIGNSCCSVYDSPATKISPDGKNAILYVWYDNEFGYTQQVIRLSKYIMGVQRKIYD